MAFIAASRVLETFTSSGTGPITLGGALIGCRTFASAMSNGDTCLYYMEGGADWEIGLGTYSAGVLTRTTVLKSSNANAAVNWPIGTKTVGLSLLGPSDLNASILIDLRAALGAIGRVAIQKFSAPGTYTPTPGMLYCIIELVGGGGAGGGAQSAAGRRHSAGGGGSGGYSRKLATAADVGTSKAVVIGSGGTGVSAGTGNTGGATSVGTLCTANGGLGGGPSISGGAAGVPGAGGAAGTGDAAMAGSPGGSGFGNDSLVGLYGGGHGGSSFFGGGAAALGPNTSSNGVAAREYGGGGSGAQGVNSATAYTGGAGSAGFVMITEFFP